MLKSVPAHFNDLVELIPFLSQKQSHGFLKQTPLPVKLKEGIRCLTWIRTKTNRVRVCRTTVILSGSLK